MMFPRFTEAITPLTDQSGLPSNLVSSGLKSLATLAVIFIVIAGMCWLWGRGKHDGPETGR